ncbi:hypothetical protein jhhlp_005481 [Lomentospora prolificans]|uniref:Major facilitator superfamily (MFS) profile domain-containing protein n=1 Tax=Lomentospora prolificans TaxID=41688 RepID=A0A2N3N6Z2_9PEZI|nr:hypothetical protein jhhlp_005481 [Lomentospora prolificans]
MATQIQTQTEPVLLEPIVYYPELEPNHSLPGSHHDISETSNASNTSAVLTASRLRKTLVTFQLSGINFAYSAVNGLVVIGLPKMTEELNLPESLAFWPASVSGLTTASTLLLAGSVADVLGPRSVDLVGCITSGAFMLGCGFVNKGEDLVVLRALQGLGIALHLSSSVSLVTKIVPRGRARNISFACLGLSQPLGFSFGLVVGGTLVDTLGWRAGWYLYGSITLLLAAIGFWSLPKSTESRSMNSLIGDLRTKVDWVGALLASAFMAMLSYFLAIISTDIYRIKEAGTIVFLCLGVSALPLFIGWVHRQVLRGKPALIPNSFWRIPSFSSICVTIALSFAVLNALELFASLFFQEIQHLSALQAAVRILPSLVVGTILNFTTGLFVHKVPANWIVVSTALLTAGAPLLMAVIKPQWPYWANAFVAQLLMPISCDVLFTVGLIIITDVFPENKQAVAGAVFNTASQFGQAFGLAIMQVVSTLVAKDYDGMSRAGALMQGYRASFWAMFAFMLACAVLGGIGLRKTGKQAWGEAVLTQCGPYIFYVQLSRCRSLYGIMLLSKARKRDFVGNRVPDNMVAAEKRLEQLSERTIREAESWDWPWTGDNSDEAYRLGPF